MDEPFRCPDTDDPCLPMAMAREVMKGMPMADLSAIKELAVAQAEDDGLWFEAHTAAEAYLQQELRRLHEAVEDADG